MECINSLLNALLGNKYLSIHQSLYLDPQGIDRDREYVIFNSKRICVVLFSYVKKKCFMTKLFNLIDNNTDSLAVIQIAVFLAILDYPQRYR